MSIMSSSNCLGVLRCDWDLSFADLPNTAKTGRVFVLSGGMQTELSVSSHYRF